MQNQGNTSIEIGVVPDGKKDDDEYLHEHSKNVC